MAIVLAISEIQASVPVAALAWSRIVSRTFYQMGWEQATQVIRLPNTNCCSKIERASGKDIQYGYQPTPANRRQMLAAVLLSIASTNSRYSSQGTFNLVSYELLGIRIRVISRLAVRESLNVPML